MKKFFSVMVASICVCSSFLYAFADTSQELPPETDSPGYARDYLLEGESWLCEEHAVIYDPAFPDNVCYRCWRDAQEFQELQSYSVSPYSLANFLDESGVSTLADASGGTTIQDNQFNPVGVVTRTGSGDSWVHATYNEAGGFYVGDIFSSSGSFWFGFQQVKSATYTPYSWVVFALAPNGENRDLVGSDYSFKVGSSYSYSNLQAVPRTVTAHGNDGKYYYAFLLGTSSCTGDYFTFKVHRNSSASSYFAVTSLELSQIQLYPGTADDQSPPAGWYSGDPNYDGGDTPAPPTDIEIIGGYFDELFSWLENIRDNLTNGFSGLALSIDNSVQQAKIAITNGIDSMKSAVVSGLSSVQSVVSTGFQGLKDYLDNVFGTTVSGDVSDTAGGIVDSIGQQEQTEQEFYTGFDSSVEQFSPDSYAVPTDIGNSIVWILGCFTGLFDGLGSYKAVFLFVPAVSISLAMIGRIAQVTPGAYRAASRSHVFSNSNEHVKKE